MRPSPSRLTRRRWLGTAAASLGLPHLVAQAAEAAPYPGRSVKLIVPFAPGGATDAVARILSQPLSRGLGQAVVIDNRPGANGTIGTDAVARAQPDGHTLLLNTAGAQTLSPLLQKTGYRPLASFAPISLICHVGLMLVVHPAVPARTLPELRSWLQERHRPVSFSAGSSMIELIGEQLRRSLQAPDMVIASYKGTGPQLQAVVSGEVDMTVDPFTGLQLLKAGKLRAIGLCGTQRTPSLPDLPTLQEAGLTDMDFSSWCGLLAPAGTPAGIVRRLHGEIQRALAQAEVREALRRLDYDPVGSSPEQLAHTIEEDTARWTRLIQASPLQTRDLP